MRGINGKVAIVTGGARSIGAAVVKELVQEGASVTIIDVLTDEGEALAAELGEKVLFTQADLRSDEQLGHSVDQTVEKFGGIDFIINAAASYHDKGFDSTRADWMFTFDVNVFGSVMLLQKAYPHLARSGAGAVVNFSSESAHAAQAKRWVYPCTKAAIEELTRSQALDVAKDNIRVNAVIPGWTWSTPISKAHKEKPEWVDQLAAQFHMNGRIGTAEEVARAVLFLCSTDASLITGSMLPVDGGHAALGPQGTLELAPPQ
jgi:NAD(P)-dependent dehydrogenase (short-subunit alcohol dehydrogenase family)